VLRLKLDFRKYWEKPNIYGANEILMLHSVWLTTSDPEMPFVRVKEDEDEPEIDFDVKTVEKLVDRLGACCNRAYTFFCDNVPGYGDLPPKLYDSGAFGPPQ
jgi:hypothetical protein